MGKDAKRPPGLEALLKLALDGDLNEADAQAPSIVRAHRYMLHSFNLTLPHGRLRYLRASSNISAVCN